MPVEFLVWAKGISRHKCLRATRNDFATLHLQNLLGFEPSWSGSLPLPQAKNITDTLVGPIFGAGEGNRTLV